MQITRKIPCITFLINFEIVSFWAHFRPLLAWKPQNKNFPNQIPVNFEILCCYNFMQKIRKVPRADYGKPHFGPQNPRKKLISHFFISKNPTPSLFKFSDALTSCKNQKISKSSAGWKLQPNGQMDKQVNGQRVFHKISLRASICDHSFSPYAKFPEKLTFLTTWYTHVRVPIKG